MSARVTLRSRRLPAGRHDPPEDVSVLPQRLAVRTLIVGSLLVVCGLAASAQHAWVLDWLREYASGNRAVVAERLRSVGSLKAFQDDLDRLTPEWLKTPGADADAQRRIVAAFALEAANARIDEGTRAAALLEWGCRQIRRDPKPGAFDRRWHLAALAVLEGAVAPDTLEAHVLHMRFQFPQEPRLALASAIAEELRTTPSYPEKMSSTDIAKHNEEAARRFRQAATDDTLKAEANLRLGHTLLALGRPDQALAALDQVGHADDAAMNYLTQVFRGQAFDRLGRLDDARAAYEAALTIAPGAQTATLSLAALLFRHGHADDAARLTDALLRQPGPRADPWWVYWPADYRHIDTLLGQMRAAIGGATR